MIHRLVAWSSRHPWIVIVVALLFAGGGAVAWRGLSRDVVPDLADPQITLLATWMGHPAADVEKEVTRVLTQTLDGVSGSTSVRGLSMSGMAYVDITLDPTADMTHDHEAIVARVIQARSELPRDVRLEVGPAASGNSWVFQYVIYDPTQHESPLALRRMQDELIRPALASIPGVAEVASLGGNTQEVRVDLKGEKLEKSGLAFTDVIDALRPLFALPRSSTLANLLGLRIAIPGHDGETAQLLDLATVRLDDEMPAGVADLAGRWEAVGGVVLAERNANLFSLVENVKRVLSLEHAQLPSTVKLATVYDRTEVATRVGRTMMSALVEEIAVAAFVILIFLLHGRSALVPLLTLPLAVLMTFGAMWLLRVPATIMSLGGIGIALGMAVDAEVVALEACHRRLESLPHGGGGRRDAMVAAASAFAPAILTSLMITAVAFLPVLAFTGETARLVRPLALTKTLVIASIAVVTLVVAPALRDKLVRGRVVREFDNPLTRILVRIYRPFVHFALAHPGPTLVTAALAVASCLPIVTHLGGEFLPRVEEGDLLFMPTTLPGVTPQHAAREMRKLDRVIGGFSQVSTVFGKVGRAETATDPAPFSMAETTIRLRPRSEWPEVARVRWYSSWASGVFRRVLGWVWPEKGVQSTAELVDTLDDATRMPGWTSAWTSPARARADMMSTGIRTPVGIRVVAASAARSDELATALRTLALRVPGEKSAVLESLGGETRLRFTADPSALALHHVDANLVQSTAELVISGGQLGEMLVDGRPLRVRIAPAPMDLRGPADELREVTVHAAFGDGGQPVPLALLGSPVFETTPAAVRTERGEIVAYVYVDLSSDTDPVGYVERAQQELKGAIASGEIHLDKGERVEWTGQSELFSAGARRLRWIVALVAASMLGLLYLQFRRLTEAAIVLISVPFALVGSFWTLFLLGYPLSAPVWVGLLSVTGLAMQTAVVMVVYIDESFYRRLREGKIEGRDDIIAAHADGTVRRLRPKIMTITTMAAGLFPLLWAEGAGAEVMKRVAAPMIGGLATSAFLTLEVLPVLYTIWRCHQLRKAQRLGMSIAEIVGPAPTWARV